MGEVANLAGTSCYVRLTSGSSTRGRRKNMDYSMVTFIWGVIVGVISTLIAMGLMFGGSKKARTRRAKQKARDMWSVWQDEGH